ncbi:MAG: hypothetical protein AAGA97_01160 [Pseudomonadota bacterium]
MAGRAATRQRETGDRVGIESVEIRAGRAAHMNHETGQGTRARPLGPAQAFSVLEIAARRGGLLLLVFPERQGAENLSYLMRSCWKAQ